METINETFSLFDIELFYCSTSQVRKLFNIHHR